MTIKNAYQLMLMSMMKHHRQFKFLNDCVDFLHVDSVDGGYVSNITLASLFIKQIRGFTTPFLDIDPSDYLSISRSHIGRELQEVSAKRR